MNEMVADFRGPTTNFTALMDLPTGPVPTEPYRSPAYFELERERIFKRAWLCLGREERLEKPGSYFVQPIEVAKASVLVCRQKDGSIKAFHNVCAHRSNTLVLDTEGTATRFVCRYHNWTYRNDGALAGVPDERNFFGLDKKTCGLKSIATETWEGWIFINLQREPEVSLAEFLGDFGEQYRGIPYQNANKSILYVSHLNANWKVIADAFAETYHIPAIHPETIGSTFASKENPYARPISAQGWGPHRSVSTYGNPEYAPPERARVERLAYSSIATGNVLSAAGLDDMDVFLKHPAINPTKSQHWAVDVTWLFPHFQLDVSPGGFWTHHFWPVTYNSTRWEARFHMPDAQDVWQRLQQEHYIARLGEILLEDVGNTERTQQGLESGAHDTMPLQDGEVMIRHNLHHVQKWIDAETARDALA
ncbi:aromatic ring-hydroxylating oxygenase subunit alpha [Sphingomonas sp. ID0503]|uniref:aromatic ring-hydroxylating oxygenase subunit alpha n=1 Tax=Sphingomonas sp. ID0503 TaxID=3399691 RepID=UPI003AFA16AD